MENKHELAGLKAIDTGSMLEEIRNLLNITIETMCKNMGWENHKYYNFIKHGRLDKDGNKKKSSPSVNKVFDGINFAIKTSKRWSEKQTEITHIVIKHVLHEVSLK